MASTKQNVPPQPPNVYQLIRGEARGEERTHFAGSAQYYYCSITYQAWQAPSGMTSDVLSLCGVQGDTCIEVVVVRMTKLSPAHLYKPRYQPGTAPPPSAAAATSDRLGGSRQGRNLGTQPPAG